MSARISVLRWLYLNLPVLLLLASGPVLAGEPVGAAGNETQPIPFNQLGAEAQKKYSGDGIGITPTKDGARLRAIMQRLTGEATSEGLWLTSTADEDAGKPNRFRVRAMMVGRERSADTLVPLGSKGGAAAKAFEMRTGAAEPRSESALPCSGIVRATKDAAAWLRPGIIEEYTVSTDGVRQDFVIMERPGGAGDTLAVELEITGASAEAASYGAKLVVGATGRELAYSRLHVTDAKGRELSARMVVRNEKRLVLRVEDADAVYPVRIDPTFSDADWVALNSSIPGADNIVYAMAIDGSGTLYVGGTFTGVGTVTANGIAKWNGSAWSALGSGVNGSVRTLGVSGGDLYVGGIFTTAGGLTANHVAKWNGSTWSALGSGMNSLVNALVVNGSDLYAGGNFTTAGGATANYIAKWNGTTWSALDVGVNGTVYAVAVSGSNVYAGGDFTTAGGASANRIAKWNGSSWSGLGSGMNNRVSALAVGGSNLYAGGNFSTAGGVGANSIAKWNGSAWSALGSGIGGGQVLALSMVGSDLYVAGVFTSAGSVTANSVARWNGSSWTAFGSGVSGLGATAWVYALAVSGSDLYVGGDLITAGGQSALRVAKWNGSVWSALGSGMNGTVRSLAVRGGDLYVGGDFTRIGGANANYIAKWNGSAWSALGSGMNAFVAALVFVGNDLYAGGVFSTAGGTRAVRVARWNGSAWSDIGAEMNSNVQALAANGSTLYVGGLFTTAGGMSANYIAQWNGSVWSALGPGMNSSVGTLTVMGGDLYAGGSFTTAGGVSANYIAKWDGSAWSPLGSGMGGSSPYVYALAASGGDLYAGGNFTTAGGVTVNRIARWDGSGWSALGSGMNVAVSALASNGSDLYAGGSFSTAGGSSALRIAKWNGSTWSALGSGIGGNTTPSASISALAIDPLGRLFVGGNFTTAGTTFSPFVTQANIGSSDPDIAIEQPAGADFIDGMTSAGFGKISPGNTRSLNFTIKNAGSADLTSLAIIIDGVDSADFTVTASPTALVPPGGSTSFTVRFAPSSIGAKTAALHITSNDPDENPFDITLTGTGTASLPFAWGENLDGQLGDATTTRRASAVPVNNAGVLAGKIVKDMAVGGSHSVALCTDGTLAAWGDNTSGQLGDGTNASSPVPVAVVTAGTPLAGKTVVAIAAGESHSMALCSDGTLATWGEGGSGQLGNGGTVPRNTPGGVTTAGTPLATRTVSAISAGSLFNVVLCTDGTPVTWGYNGYGQLGNNSIVVSSVPVAVITTGTPLAGRTITSVAAGGDHLLALCSDGTLASWGRNIEGQVGDNTLTSRLLPVAVQTTGTALAGKTVIGLASGGFHSLVRCADGTLAAWGYGGFGELGDGLAAASKIAVAVTMAGTPLAGKTVEEIAAGNLHSLARCTDGTMAAWGYGVQGQLGNGTFVGRIVPTLVGTTALAAGEKFIRLFSGPSANHSLALSSAQPAAGIVVEQPLGSGIAEGTGVASMGSAAINTSGVTKIFTIKNPGILPLTGLAITKDGANAADYSFTPPQSTTITPGGSTTFTVTFSTAVLGTRTAALHIASNVTGSANPYDFGLTGDGATYSQNWLQTYFGTSSNTGSAADDFDFDGDGLVNLVERAFGLDPTQGSSATLPQGQTSGGNFVVNFTEPTGMTGVVYGAEWSATMQPLDWHTIPDTGTPPQHVFSVPATGQIFVRLKVTGQ